MKIFIAMVCLMMASCTTTIKTKTTSGSIQPQQSRVCPKDMVILERNLLIPFNYRRYVTESGALCIPVAIDQSTLHSLVNSL